VSIIYDALKKLEQRAVTEAKPQPKDKVLKWQKVKLIAVYILTAGIGLGIGNFIFSAFAPPSIPDAKVVRHVTPVQELKQAQVIVPVIQSPSQEVLPSPALVLNGVFFSQEEGYALINNQIVREGDEVNGAKVKKISMNEVELDTLGSSVKLSYRKK